jgi:hypothetical protein
LGAFSIARRESTPPKKQRCWWGSGKPLAVREFQINDGCCFVISELLAYGEARKWFRILSCQGEPSG